MLIFSWSFCNILPETVGVSVSSSTACKCCVTKSVLSYITSFVYI